MNPTTSSPTSSSVAAVLAQWTAWLSRITDTLLSLEDRCLTAGTPKDSADIAAAFVARKAVAERLAAIEALPSGARQRADELVQAPVVDEIGGPVGADLSDAAALVDGIVNAVAGRIAGREGAQLAEATGATAATADLEVAGRLASSLGAHANRVEALRQQLARRDHLADLAVATAAVRTELEGLDAQRTAMFERWSMLPERINELAGREAAVVALADRCRAKVRRAPNLAVPSVRALGDTLSVDELRSLPWAAARARMLPELQRVDRLGRAFDEAERRFTAALGLGEDASLEPMYRAAETVLWSAPADVEAARALVERYVAAVNDRTKGGPG